MKMPKEVSEYLLANKTKHSSFLVMDVYDQFGLSLTAKQVSRHLCYKGAGVTKKSDTYMEVPSELADKYDHHYIVQRKGTWMIRAKQGNTSSYTCTLLSKALLEHRYGITISPQAMVLHINDDVSDMSEDNIIAIPRGVYNRARKLPIYDTSIPDMRRLLLTVAWSEHLLFLSLKHEESERDDVRSKIAGQIQSDITLYDISQRPLRIS